MTIDQYVGQTLVSAEGEKIGSIADVYLDAQTQKPEWFVARTGLFGSKVGFVPIAGAGWTDDERVMVPYSKSDVKDAPHIEPGGELSRDEEARLYGHYGLQYSERESATGLPSGSGGAATPRSTRTADAGMTRSEEELVAGKKTQAVGRARLVKYVETEHKNVTIPIKRDRVKLVTEPIRDTDREGEIREGAQEQTLYEEEPVVGKRTVPKERVRLEKETQTEDREVGADLRKERIRTEGDVETKR